MRGRCWQIRCLPREEYDGESSERAHEYYDRRWKIIKDKWGPEGLTYANIDSYEDQFSPEELLGYTSVEVLELSFPSTTPIQDAPETMIYRSYFLILEPHNIIDGKWKCVGMGISKGILREPGEPRPKLMFDDCDYEDICLM